MEFVREKTVSINSLKKEIIGYNNKKYTIEELRQLCPSNLEIKQHIAIEKKTHEFRKKYELIYNSQADILENEIWVRLSQKRFENFFVSNKARIRWITPEGAIIFLRQDEDPSLPGSIGYLVVDAENKYPDLHNLNQRKYLRTYTLVAMAFLGKRKYEYDGIHVHHIDNNGYNCTPENLILLDRDTHLQLIHHK